MPIRSPDLRWSSHHRRALVPATLQVPFNRSRKLLKEPFTPTPSSRFAPEYPQFIAAQNVEMPAFKAVTYSLDDLGENARLK